MSDRPTPLCDAVVRDSDGFLETARNMEKLARRLERQRDAAVEALTKLLVALEAEAKAELSYKVARENFSDPRPEDKVLSKAILATSNVCKEARAVLAEIEGKS